MSEVRTQTDFCFEVQLPESPFHCAKITMSDHKESGVLHSALGGCDSDGWESEESEIVDPSEDFRLACSKVPDSKRFRQEDGLTTPHRFLVEALAFGQFDYAFEQIVLSDPPVDVSTTISMYSPETYDGGGMDAEPMGLLDAVVYNFDHDGPSGFYNLDKRLLTCLVLLTGSDIAELSATPGCEVTEAVIYSGPGDICDAILEACGTDAATRRTQWPATRERLAFATEQGLEILKIFVEIAGDAGLAALKKVLAPRSAHKYRGMVSTSRSCNQH